MLVYPRATTVAFAANRSTMAPICGVPRASHTTPLTVAGRGEAMAGKRPAIVITIRTAIWEYLLFTQYATRSTHCSNPAFCAQSYSLQLIRALINRKRRRLRDLLLGHMVVDRYGHLVLTRL